MGKMSYKDSAGQGSNNRKTPAPQPVIKASMKGVGNGQPGGGKASGMGGRSSMTKDND